MNRTGALAISTWAMLLWTAALVAQPPATSSRASAPTTAPRVAPLPQSEWAAPCLVTFSGGQDS